MNSPTTVLPRPTSAQSGFLFARALGRWTTGLAAAALLGAATVPSGASAQAAKPTPAPKTQAQPKRFYDSHAGALAWAETVAARQGWSPQWVREHLARAQFLPSSQRLATPAPAPKSGAKRSTVADWRRYRANLITAERVAAGVRFWAANEAALQRAQDVFGVPASAIVGILGVETHYGRNQGNTRVLDALATLAFDFPAAHPRAAQRSAYFAGELEAFLMSIAQENDPVRAQSLAEQRGSWAGAMGMGQFMPSSLARWALDFDEDGRLDVFGHSGRADDAIGSVAHYLYAHGWQAGQSVWHALEFAAAPDWEKLLAPDIVPSFTPAQLAALGAQPAAPSTLGADVPLAVIALNRGDAPTGYFLGTRNFYVLTRYNQSSYYAAAVHDLGQEIAAARSRTAPQVIELTLP